MCGRFNIIAETETLFAAFQIQQQDLDFANISPRYNISPSKRETDIAHAPENSLTRIPIIRKDEGQTHLKLAIWPMIPVWAKGKIPKYSTANARSETMTELASFRNAWRQGRRCLIPATGFYEWQIVPGVKHKQPWHIRHKHQEIMSFAGLWEQTRLSDGKVIDSCTIVTTQANSLMSEIHNSSYRMPVIIDPAYREQWLSKNHDAALSLAKSYPDGLLEADRISTLVNNPKAGSTDVISPLVDEKS